MHTNIRSTKDSIFADYDKEKHDSVSVKQCFINDYKAEEDKINWVYFYDFFSITHYAKNGWENNLPKLFYNVDPRNNRFIFNWLYVNR